MVFGYQQAPRGGEVSLGSPGAGPSLDHWPQGWVFAQFGVLQIALASLPQGGDVNGGVVVLLELDSLAPLVLRDAPREVLLAPWALLAASFCAQHGLALVSPHISPLAAPLVVPGELRLQMLLRKPVIWVAIIPNRLFRASLKGPLGCEFKVHGVLLMGRGRAQRRSRGEALGEAVEPGFRAVGSRAGVQLIGGRWMAPVGLSPLYREVRVELV